MPTSHASTWAFPCTPTAPDWTFAWQSLQEQFSWLQAMDGIPQDAIFHAEGDVLVHTGMVTEALIQSSEWKELPASEQTLLFAAALLHDVGKPACTKIEDNGRITSRGHARKGEYITRQELTLGRELLAPVPFVQREYIARLVRYHGLPLQFIDKPDPERAAIEASQSIRLDHVALLAEADVRGRICADKDELLSCVELFRSFCREQVCYKAPHAFASSYSRFVYFHSEHGDPNYAAYDNSKFEVTLMSGLPGAGKDTWLQTHYPELPVISLDAIRHELKITAEDDQGHVIQIARERARQFMRKQQSFAWNATNITRMLRGQLIDLFVAYGGRVRIIYIDTPFQHILQRNQSRQASVPETVLYKLLGKLEVPDPIEAHQVEWVIDA